MSTNKDYETLLKRVESAELEVKKLKAILSKPVDSVITRLEWLEQANEIFVTALEGIAFGNYGSAQIVAAKALREAGKQQLEFDFR